MKRTEIKQLFAPEGQQLIGTDVVVKGWVRTKRGNKNVAFIALNDGSTINNIQVVVDPTSFDPEMLRRITTGACIGVQGQLVASQGAGQSVEVQARNIEIYGEADPDSYPLQKKGHSMEFLREIGHLRPRTNTFGAVCRIRHHMAYAIHTFFHERGFFYFHTPLITASDCEGAGEMFQVTTLDLKNPPRLEDGSIDYSQDFFGKQTALTVSGQLEGELGATALGKIYTFGPTFRAENSNTPRHLAEFWMIEPEMAFYDIDDLTALEEEFIKYCVTWALEHCQDDLQFRVDLASEHERFLVEEHFKKPVIMIDYPKEMKAFYMKPNEDGKTVQGTDVLFPQIGEIIGGSVREENYDKLMNSITERNIPMKDMWWYLDTRRYGTCPHAGFGLGFERLMLFVTGMANIRDVIPFPRTPNTAEF